MTTKKSAAKIDELDRVQLAFDRVAGRMDDVVLLNPINAWMRRVNMTYLRRTFPPGSRLLELGCGTGSDAIELARNGRYVFAIDLSPEMVKVAAEKVTKLGLQDSVKFTCGRNRDLLELIDESPWKSFDGGYANFSLTYEESLDGVVRSLSRLLACGAPFLCTLPNRTVLSELAIYGPLLRFDRVLWRFQDPLTKDVHGENLRIRAYSPWQVRDAFQPWFRLDKIIGIPTFLPPVYLHQQYRRLISLEQVMQWMDALLGPRFPWNRLGEHTLYLFQKSAVIP